MLYLSARDIATLDLSSDAVREAVEAAYAAAARGEAHAPPKLGIDLGSGRTLHALAGALTGRGLAALKWASVVPAEAAPSGVTVKASIILTHTETGEPAALLDGVWITAARTAAMSAIAARRLARADATSVAFIGCGVQARSHLHALARVLPKLQSVVAFSRSRTSAERLASEAQARGFDASVRSDAAAAVTGADVVVTSVPAEPGFKPFLDPAWFAPDCFVAAVDLGRSIMKQNLGCFGVLATDDRAQSEALGQAGKLLCAGPFAFDLADLAGGRAPARRDRPERVLFVFAGHALADVAAAWAVYEAARARGIGVQLSP